MDRVDWNAELIRGDLGQAVQQLKPEPGKGLFKVIFGTWLGERCAPEGLRLLYRDATPDLGCRPTEGDMPHARSVCVLFAALAPFTFQGQVGSSQRSLPPPTDIDAMFTEQLSQAEQQFCKAILNKDARTLDSLLSPNFALRVADVPQSSLPRTVWMDNTLHRITGEFCEQHHVVARKLADDLAAVSLVWSQKATSDGRNFSGEFYLVDLWQRSSGNWQIIARYSTPLGKFPERPARQLPPAGDVDPDLTEHLRQLEQQFGEASMHGDTQVVDRLMGADFTLRVGDAPERSVPRTLREDLRPQATRAYTMESFEERHQAARKLTNDIAVVSLLLSQKATFAGRDRSGDFYVVDIWRKTAGNWQIIARYSTPLGKRLDRSP